VVDDGQSDVRGSILAQIEKEEEEEEPSANAQTESPTDQLQGSEAPHQAEGAGQA